MATATTQSQTVPAISPDPGLQRTRAILALDAALLTMIGSALPGELKFVLAVPVLGLACGIAWLAAARPSRSASMRTTHAAMAAAAALALAAPRIGTSLSYEMIYRLHPLIGLVAIASAFGASPGTRRRAALAVGMSATILYAVTPAAVSPNIDVWSWTQTAADAFVHGIHPYTVVAPDVYGGAYDFGSTPPAFPYMPAALLLVAPSLAILHDYRYALALCLPATLILIRYAARRVKADRELTDLVTIALALNPRGAQMVALGYMEPLLIITAAAFVAFAVRGQRLCEAAAFLLLPGIKQYVAAPVVLYAVVRRRPRPLMGGVAVAFATVAPFLAWNFHATTTGIFFLLRAPLGYRADSLSISAAAARLTGMHSTRWVAIAAQFAAAALAYPFASTSGLAGVLLGSALSLFVCFLFATQAFFNYYAFVAALLLYAAAIGSRGDSRVWE